MQLLLSSHHLFGRRCHEEVHERQTRKKNCINLPIIIVIKGRQSSALPPLKIEWKVNSSIKWRASKSIGRMNVRAQNIMITIINAGSRVVPRKITNFCSALLLMMPVPFKIKRLCSSRQIIVLTKG